MLCSPAEIEMKRQEALKRLAEKGRSPIKRGSPSSFRNGFSKSLLNNDLTDNSPAKIPRLEYGLSITNKPLDQASSSNHSSKSNKTVCDFFKMPATVRINLIDCDRFTVQMSSFLQSVVDVFKTIPSKNYDPKSKAWSFHIKDYDHIISRLRKLKGDNIVVEPLPTFVIKCLKDNLSIEDIDLSKNIDNTLFQTLLPFQLEGVQFGVKQSGRCLIADDMGLGKTFQALGIMNYYKNDWPLLIVTTASMRNVWEETILNYIPSVSILQVQYMVSGKDFITDSLVLIVSHDLMSRCSDKLAERGFGCIIIDESHTIKNYKTKSTQAAIKLCKLAKRVVLLSGTPALSRPKELYSQLSLIDSTFFKSFFQYAKRYCDMQQTAFGMNTLGKSNLQELEIILKKKFMIRRRKEDVLGTLPNKTQEIVKLNINFKSLDNQEKEILANLSSQYTNTKLMKDKQSILLTLFSETAKIKAPTVCSHVEAVLRTKEKILVFAHHHVMLDSVETVVKKNNYKYIRIDGNTSVDQRKYFIDKFQTDPSYLCAILSITSANAGITLTAARHVVFAELHWNPSILNQAEARVHRIGQEKTVLVQYLLADGTADDYIWPLLQEKENILQEMGLSKASFSRVQKSSSNESAQDLIDDDSVLDDGLDDILCAIDI